MKSHTRLLTVLHGCLLLALTACDARPSRRRATSKPSVKVPPNMHLVEPMTAASSDSHSSPAGKKARELKLGQSQFFTYALPEGWKLGEDGQYAISLGAPDGKALTLMVGNAGMPANYPPSQYVAEKLSVLQPEDLEVSQPAEATPMAGFRAAFQFEVTYSISGNPCRGIVKCHVAPAYDTCLLVMTAALSDATQWDDYSAWLPLVADQISATNGAAFGMRGVMQQNLQNSTAYAQAAKSYREHSQKLQQQTTDERNASLDRQNADVRENLAASYAYTNPYDKQNPVELPPTYQYYWVDRDGTVLGTDDPSANPNTGSTGDWSLMKRQRN